MRDTLLALQAKLEEEIERDAATQGGNDSDVRMERIEWELWRQWHEMRVTNEMPKPEFAQKFAPAFAATLTTTANNGGL